MFKTIISSDDKLIEKEFKERKDAVEFGSTYIRTHHGEAYNIKVVEVKKYDN